MEEIELCAAVAPIVTGDGDVNSIEAYALPRRGSHPGSALPSFAPIHARGEAGGLEDVLEVAQHHLAVEVLTQRDQR